MCCRCGGNNQVGGVTSYPCREQLRALERCLQSLVSPSPGPGGTNRHCCCCCCCCNRGGRGSNQTNWGR